MYHSIFVLLASARSPSGPASQAFASFGRKTCSRLCFCLTWCCVLSRSKLQLKSRIKTNSFSSSVEWLFCYSCAALLPSDCYLKRKTNYHVYDCTLSAILLGTVQVLSKIVQERLANLGWGRSWRVQGTAFFDLFMSYNYTGMSHQLEIQKEPRLFGNK